MKQSTMKDLNYDFINESALYWEKFKEKYILHIVYQTLPNITGNSKNEIVSLNAIKNSVKETIGMW